MQLQVLDCDYTLLNGKPLIRLFCKDRQGETRVVFYDKFLPYFYLETDVRKEAVEDEVRKWGCTVDWVEKTIPTGYQQKKKVLKITGRDPSRTPEIRESVKKFGRLYEADVLFKYRFMIDFGIRGMGWIEVTGPQARTLTVPCPAIQAEEIRPLEIMENAPLKYLSFDIECITKGDRVPEPEKDEIIMVSMVFSPEHQKKKTIVLTSKFISGGKDVVCAENEEEMLKKFSEIVSQYDPDILIGYNINNFDFPFIIGRMEKYNIPKILGRCSKPAYVRKVMGTTQCSVTGRVIVDPYQLLKNDPWISLRRYNLATAAKTLLGEEKLDVGGPKEIVALWNGKTEDHVKLVDYCRKDSDLALKLVQKQGMVQKFSELAKVSGVLLQDSFGGQTLRLDTRIMHEFKNYGYIMPCRPNEGEMYSRKRDREKAGLKGALVLEPEVGLHAKGSVLVLDFTSLYPSIICAYNICPTTLTLDEKISHKTSPFGSKFVTPDVREGIVPKIIKEFLSARKAVKKQMRYEKDLVKKAALNARQLALKTMSNSVHPNTPIVVRDNNGKVRVIKIVDLFDEISKNRKIKRVGNVQVVELSGWETLSVEGDKSCFKPLYAVSKHRNKENLIKIRTRMGEVIVTKDHSVISAKGKSDHRIRKCKFTGLREVRGSEISSDTVVAQINNFKIGTGYEKELNLVDILCQLPNNQINDMCLHLPKSMNLNKHSWADNRIKLFEYMKRVGRANSKKLQDELGFDRRVFRKSENYGLKRVGYTTIGNCGIVPDYEFTDEAGEYLEFLKLFRKIGRRGATHYTISLNKLRGVRIPRKILMKSKIAVGPGTGKGRVKLSCIIPITNELAEIFGWYVAEGSVYKRKYSRGCWYKASISNYDRKVLLRLNKIINKVFNYKVGFYKKDVSLNTKVFYLLFRHLCGKNSYHKKIPDFIINSDRSIRKIFLDVYTKGDGDADGRRLTTVSKKLADQLCFLLKEENNILHFSKEGKFYRISRRGSTIGKKIVSGDLYCQTPVEISESESTDYVYDLSVKGTEKFSTAQGLVLHNSMYGYTGYIRSKLYKIDLAASITSVGRENITKTQKLINDKYGYKIIYSDTDSVFVDVDVTDLDEAQKIGEEVSGYVTNNLDGLELKFEKILKSFLILAKKRYAGWSFEKTPFGWNEKIYMKGIETVRRDWCPVVGETMKKVLDIVLKEGDIKKASHLVREVMQDVIEGKTPLEKLTIVKGLTKSVDAYDGVQAHVELAKKIMKRDPSRGKLVGERIGFVIVRGNQMLSKRSEDPQYVKEHGLKIDPHYYIENQLLPPLQRIFDACGVSKAELKEGSKQKNLFDMLGGRTKTPAQTILDSYESVSCQKCDWAAERPTLTGKCPTCQGRLYFKKGATLGKWVKV